MRGKAPEDREIGAWFGDLSNRLGSLQPNRLQVAFTMTREENAERRAAGKYGQLSIDDVIRAYRKAPRDPEDIPEDPYCPHDCDRGETYMIDREGYETLVPCSCQAGEYLREPGRLGSAVRCGSSTTTDASSHATRTGTRLPSSWGRASGGRAEFVGVRSAAGRDARSRPAKEVRC